MYILVHKQTGKCYDLVSDTFPVHSDFEWVDVGGLDTMPEHGWLGTKVGENWTFTSGD